MTYITNSYEFRKDLGVVVDTKLKLTEHIDKKVNKANSIIKVIRRSLKLMNCKNFNRL